MFAKIYTKTTSFFASKKFFWAVVILFVLESLWIALSFGYPLVYDEAFHFPVIKIFSHNLIPFIFNQPHSYDLYGSFMYGDASLYHYTMSFPYRLIELFTRSFTVQVIILRILNIGLVASGLLIFSRLFRLIGIRQIFINISLLLFILIPLVSFVSATINYDNMLFPLTAWYLLLCARLLKDKKVNWQNYTAIIIVGCFASLVKYSFLPVFAVSIIYLTVVSLRRHRNKFLPQLLNSIKSSSNLAIVTMAILLIVSVALFAVRDIQSVIRYGSPRPDCSKVMAQNRCLDYSDKRNILAAKTKGERPTVSLPQYATRWFSSNLWTTNRAVAVGKGWGDYKAPLPIMGTSFFFMVILGLGGLIYAWRSLPKNASWYFLMTIIVTLFLSVFTINYQIYLKLHQGYAIQPRYFLNLLPVLMVMMVIAANFILRKKKWLKVGALALILLIFTQGGGPITNILRSSDYWYWQNQKVIKANHLAKQILAPIVKEQ